ncbi:hypothetical protein MAR_031596 [Mya arenaria]|uniref:Tyrosine-protein phosphatase domain-containing protein n=1 Tax=Mya arenaria TaxID=6604 RepID=A0ABY7F499_MYAAR|nr:hypothetical protein MAR_031596 [Mya arenaria]
MGEEGFNRQFQEMQTVLEKPPGYEMQATERNNRIKGGNIPLTAIPGDRNRHCRILDSSPRAPECMNAVYIDKQNVGLYYPAGNHVLKQGMFQVSCTKQENYGYCTKRLLTIKHNEPNGQSSEREVTHFEFNAWDNTSDVPMSSKNYVDLIKRVDANLRETSNRGPAKFEFCHECVLSYIKSIDYSQYSNFTGCNSTRLSVDTRCILRIFDSAKPGASVS